MTPCQRIRRLIDDFVEGEIEEQDRKAVEAHLASCPACHHCATQLQALRARLKRLKPVHTSDDFLIRLRNRLREEAASTMVAPGNPRRSFGLRWVWAGGAALIVLVLPLLVHDHASNPFLYEPAIPSSSPSTTFSEMRDEEEPEGWPLTLMGQAPEVSPVDRAEREPQGIFSDSIRIRDHRNEGSSWIRTVSY